MSNKKKFDKEYSTQWINEVEYLHANGIRWTFVFTNADGISTYKYTKNYELFYHLAKFYENVYTANN